MFFSEKLEKLGLSGALSDKLRDSVSDVVTMSELNIVDDETKRADELIEKQVKEKFPEVYKKATEASKDEPKKVEKPEPKAEKKQKGEKKEEKKEQKPKVEKKPEKKEVKINLGKIKEKNKTHHNTGVVLSMKGKDEVNNIISEVLDIFSKAHVKLKKLVKEPKRKLKKQKQVVKGKYLPSYKNSNIISKRLDQIFTGITKEISRSKADKIEFAKEREVVSEIADYLYIILNEIDALSESGRNEDLTKIAKLFREMTKKTLENDDVELKYEHEDYLKQVIKARFGKKTK